MKLKFCGLRRAEDMAWFNESPADYLGFVFAPGRRQVDAAAASGLLRLLDESLRKSVRSVGVFSDQNLEEVVEIAAAAGIDILQLHGNEDAAYLLELKRRTGKEIWKAIKCTEENLSGFNAIPADKILIDSAKGGGSGTLADWGLIAGFKAGFDKPWILAGGLDGGNIQEAMRLLEPYGVDISSGIERDGFKDPELMKEIVRKVKGYGK